MHCSSRVTGTVRIKALRLIGPNAAPRDPNRREFHFDFGPVHQELEADFCPVSHYTIYTPSKGYGWVIPESEKIVRSVGHLNDAQIAAFGFPPVPDDVAGWYKSHLRGAYWLRQKPDH